MLCLSCFGAGALRCHGAATAFCAEQSVDFLCGGVGVEIKRGKPGVARLLPQLARYCACEEVAGLILVSEGSVRLPPTLAGKPLRNLCLNQLWGIAL